MSDHPRLVTQPKPPEAASAEDRLTNGLLNLWYLVGRSADVTDRPVPMTRLGRNLVLWRDRAGTLSVVEDYCPHRGAPLSLGEVVEGKLTCAYHGFQLDGRGCIAAVPPTPDSPLVGQKAIKAYPVREIGGAIWVYFASDDREAPEPIFPEEVTSPDWTSFLFITEWRCNWQVALDNRLDPVHGSYLHAGSFTLSRGRRDAELKVEDTPTGFQTFRTNQRNTNIDWHELVFHQDNIFWVRTEIPYPPAFGGGSFRINGHPTPIDAERTLVWFFRSRRLTGWQRDMWRFLYKNRLEARNWAVVEQDRVMLEAIPLAARKRERLIQTDVALARMRRRLQAEAARQSPDDRGA
jgi:phenylpropionate dioxygenase-like ring-hydroxylating dioxygenase large terminal subunit